MAGDPLRKRSHLLQIFVHSSQASSSQLPRSGTNVMHCTLRAPLVLTDKSMWSISSKNVVVCPTVRTMACWRLVLPNVSNQSDLVMLILHSNYEQKFDMIDCQSHQVFPQKESYERDPTKGIPPGISQSHIQSLKEWNPTNNQQPHHRADNSNPAGCLSI